MCGTLIDLRNNIFGAPPDKGAEERQAKSKAKAEVDAANASATDATNAKLRQRNAGRAASVLATGAGSNATPLKSTLGQ